TRWPPPPSPVPYTTLFRSPFPALRRFRQVVSVGLNHGKRENLGSADAPTLAFPHQQMAMAVTALPRVQRDPRSAADSGRRPRLRSEEHTSELQSRENLVCR